MSPGENKVKFYENDILDGVTGFDFSITTTKKFEMQSIL